MTRPFAFLRAAILAASLLVARSAAAAEVQWLTEGPTPRIRVLGDPDNDWRIERSTDLVTWSVDHSLSTLLAGDETNAPAKPVGDLSTREAGFFRAVRTEGLYDPTLLRTFRLRFTQPDWTNLLTLALKDGIDVPCSLTLDNGASLTGVGARYKGNSSFVMGGAKKSLNITVNYTNDDAELLGYETFNLNNAAGDETIMREPVYFTVMSRYAPSPRAALAQLYINGENWGVYSLAQNGDSDLMKDWFPNADGDRWRTPNWPADVGGGGGMFSGAGSALTYVGPNLSDYEPHYELRRTSDTNRAWLRLTNAIFTLHFNTATAADPQGEFEDYVELRNVTDQEVDLSGRYLSDEPSNPRKWSFPQGTTIPAGGFLIVWLDEDSTVTPGLHASFKLDKDGESLALVDTDTNLNLLLDSTTFGPLGADQAWARPAANPTLFQIQAPSPGAANP